MVFLHMMLSLLLLVLVGVLLFCYICFFIMVFRYIRQVWRGIRTWCWGKSTFLPGSEVWYFKRSRLISLGVVCALLCTGSYLYERSRWIEPDSAYPAAKEYLVTGAVLLEYRTIGIWFIHPERWIWKPSVWLQRLISKAGRSLIPEDDGEHAIWKYHFVLAPYINKLHVPRTPAAYPLIDTAESVLETLAEKKIRDKTFRNKKQYLVYPLVSLFYLHSYKGKYFLKPQPDRYLEGLYKDPAQCARLKQIVEWSIEKEKKWDEKPEVAKYMKNHPDIELVQIGSVAILLQEILRYQIHNLEFACNDRYVNLYYDYVNRFIADGSPYHRVDENMQARFRKVIIYHGVRINFFGHRLCGFEKLPNYGISEAEELKWEGPGWYEAFVELNKKLVPPEKQKKVLERVDKRE